MGRGAQAVQLRLHRFRAVPAVGHSPPATRRVLATLLASIPILGAEVAAAGVVLALIETVSAKLRIFRAPEFLATAFLFAVLGLLVHLLLGA